MNKILKQLLLKEKFDTTNVVAVIELLDESGIYTAERIVDVLINGCPKYNLNIDKIQNAAKENYSKYSVNTEITKFTKTTVNVLEDRIRVFFYKKDSKYEQYQDLYNIEQFCND